MYGPLWWKFLQSFLFSKKAILFSRPSSLCRLHYHEVSQGPKYFIWNWILLLRGWSKKQVAQQLKCCTHIYQSFSASWSSRNIAGVTTIPTYIKTSTFLRAVSSKGMRRWTASKQKNVHLSMLLREGLLQPEPQSRFSSSPLQHQTAESAEHGRADTGIH